MDGLHPSFLITFLLMNIYTSLSIIHNFTSEYFGLNEDHPIDWNVCGGLHLLGARMHRGSSYAWIIVYC